MEYKFYKSQLDEFELHLYSEISSGLLQKKKAIVVDSDVSQLQKIIKYVLLDHPELFWFEGKWRAEETSEGICMFPMYKTVINRTEEVWNQIENRLEKMLCSSKRDTCAIVRRVYDELLDTIQYGKSENDQTIEGALLDRRAVCKGIAKAFQICMNRLDIPSFLVEGTLDKQASHIWNVVYVENKFYHVDVTMGYPQFLDWFSGMDRIKRYPCFMVSDEDIGRTHIIYRNDLPVCEKSRDIKADFLKSAHITDDKFLQYGNPEYYDHGSTCDVFRIQNHEKTYALKVVDIGRAKEVYESAIKESDVLKALSQDKNIVSLIDSKLDLNDEKMYLLYPFCKSLPVRRREANFDVIKDTTQMGIDVLHALIVCREKGVFHLDVHPKNIYFNESGNAMLGDFGGCAYKEELQMLPAGRGTLAFMAPEVYTKGQYSESSEIYALGIVMYSLINDARLPFAMKYSTEEAVKIRLSGIELEVPSTGDSVLWRCVQKMCVYDVGQRYENYEQVLKELCSINK